MSAYASIVFDMDSTLSGIEGVDWLAARRGPEVAAAVSSLTARAMTGEIALDAVYGERLSLIRPTAAELAALARAYTANLAAGVGTALQRLRGAGIALALVSGGIREAIAPCAAVLGFSDRDIHAVHVHVDADGGYAGFDASSPLVTQHGKRDVVRALALPRPVLAVGDGATDAALRPVVDAFAVYTGFVRRAAVVCAADCEVQSFDDLMEIVFR